MKAIIELTKPGEYMRRAREIAKRTDAGEALPDADYHLGFANAGRLFTEFTPERCRLLDVLKADGAQSIYALAKRLGRNYSNVHRDVQAMMAHELISKDEAGRIGVPWDSIEIRVTLGLAKAA